MRTTSMHVIICCTLISTSKPATRPRQNFDAQAFQTSPRLGKDAMGQSLRTDEDVDEGHEKVSPVHLATGAVLVVQEPGIGEHKGQGEGPLVQRFPDPAYASFELESDEEEHLPSKSRREQT